MATPVSFPDCAPCCPTAGVGFCGPCIFGLGTYHLTLSASSCPYLVGGFPYPLVYNSAIATFLQVAGAWYYESPIPCGGPGFPVISGHPAFYILMVCRLSLQPGIPSQLQININFNRYVVNQPPASSCTPNGIISGGIYNVFGNWTQPCPDPFFYDLGAFTGVAAPCPAALPTGVLTL